jgi:hypothetical protein
MLGIKIAMIIASMMGLNSGDANTDGFHHLNNPNVIEERVYGGIGSWRETSGKGEYHAYTVKNKPDERIIGPYLDAETRTINLFGDTERTYYVDYISKLNNE